jgi:hypothetical protein
VGHLRPMEGWGVARPPDVLTLVWDFAAAPKSHPGGQVPLSRGWSPRGPARLSRPQGRTATTACAAVVKAAPLARKTAVCYE